MAKLALGTAQFGLDYGVSNSTGRPSEREVAAILALAWRAGMRVLDTAPAYGLAEEIVGAALRDIPGSSVITKTVSTVPGEERNATRERVLEGIRTSLRRLGVSCLHGVLVHKVDDLLGPVGPAVLEALTIAKRDGLTKSIGVSVYDEAEIDHVLRRMTPDSLQLPFSILDRRLEQSGCLRRLRASGVQIHARSVFLQGLLLMDPDRAPAHFAPVRSVLRDLRDHWARQGLNPLQGCLGFVLCHPDVDFAVIGVDSRAHLAEMLEAVSALPSEPASDPWMAPPMDEHFLSPRLWPSFP